MLLSECKLGDKILMYLDAYGGLTETTTNDTIIATIFGIDKYVSSYYVGWKNNESIPANAERRSSSAKRSVNVNYVFDELEYVRRYTICTPKRWEVASVLPSSQVNNIRHSLQNNLIDASLQWRMFRNNQPGQCPCGTNIAVCIYHKS